jgi:hypothetical protein
MGPQAAQFRFDAVSVLMGGELEPELDVLRTLNIFAILGFTSKNASPEGSVIASKNVSTANPNRILLFVPSGVLSTKM